MLLSMTGYGEAHYQSESLSLSIELRALNNRYLKVTVRAPEPYNLLEPEFEKVIRRTIRRGTIQLNMHCERQHAAGDFRINATALRSYLGQLRTMESELGIGKLGGEGLLAQVLALPGVVPEPGNSSFDADQEWPVLERVLGEALAKLQDMRQEEGRAMTQEFLLYRDQIAADLAKIRQRAPSVVTVYRERLRERVQSLLSELDIKIDRSDLIKEVSIFAERSDVAEEVVRLASHLDQFQEFMNESESPGRKLEFLTQEMFRETNTIGSKASDVEISRHVVDIKGTLEKIRELVQNIE
ncbi:MAG TPA: YicC/YloC family endoribonuclease [Gemmataceae bacterium]|nr:YicC/YloC family endoribonuclease [Gemmataceae bacterium]HEV3447417.1 YicC/YloC family endoribonuclease [Gemmataceae bacterium]